MLQRLAGVPAGQVRDAHALVADGRRLRAGNMDRTFIDGASCPSPAGGRTVGISSPKGSLAPIGLAGYLLSDEREKLRSIIHATVAPMTAERLASRYDIGLEHDSRYGPALASFCQLVVQQRIRATSLVRFLHDELPAGEPDFAKYLFIETVARQLGRKWISDDCDFIDVTIGTARLQEVIKILSFEVRNLHSSADAPSVALLVPAGEQHSLMLHLLALLFDAMGWSSQILDGRDIRGSHARAVIEQADVVCIGWSNQQLRTAFADLVATIRSYRPEPRLPIVAGGSAALDSIDFLVGLGIDCICDSVYSASRICERFFELETISQREKGSGRRAAVNASGLDGLMR